MRDPREAERLHGALLAGGEHLYGCLEGARYERRDGYVFCTYPGVPFPQFNGLLMDSTRVGSAVRDLPGLVAEVEGLEAECGVQVRAGKTVVVEEEARRLGLTAEERMAGMVATHDDLHGPDASALEILRVSDEDELCEAARVAALGFEIPAEYMAPLYSPAVAGMPGLEIYLARVDDELVSTGLGYAIDRTVGIFNVATPPEHRRRGYGTALTAHAARRGFAAGADLAWLQSSAMGESVYRELGFRVVDTYILFSRPGSELENV